MLSESLLHLQPAFKSLGLAIPDGSLSELLIYLRQERWGFSSLSLSQQTILQYQIKYHRDTTPNMARTSGKTTKGLKPMSKKVAAVKKPLLHRKRPGFNAFMVCQDRVTLTFERSYAE